MGPAYLLADLLTVDPDAFGTTREDVRLALEAADIQSRPLWKPMHPQPVYAHYVSIGGPWPSVCSATASV